MQLKTIQPNGHPHSVDGKPTIVIAHFRPDIVSGAERSIADLMDHLKDDFDFSMLVPRHGALERFYQQHGFSVRVRDVQNFRRRYPGLHWLHSWLFARELKRRGVQAVISNTFSAASRVGTACQMANIPHAIYIREYITNRTITRKILAAASAVFVISQDLKNVVSEMVDPSRVWLTYNHINPDPILKRVAAHQAAGQRLQPFPAECPVVGLIGRITPFKQQDVFIRAIPLVLAAVPRARFVVVGSAQGKDLEYETQVKELSHQLGIAEQVAFLGQRSDSIEITSELTVSCLTSTREPLGRVILEANIIGCPVVSTESGGAGEIVDDEETGLTFNANSSDSHYILAKKIIRLLQNEELRRQLAENARDKVFNTFAGDRYVHIQAGYIRDLCERVAHAAVQ